MDREADGREAVRLLLSYKGITYGHAFYFSDQPRQLYYISRQGAIMDMDGKKQNITENDVWERFDLLVMIPWKDYEKALRDYKDTYRRIGGKPTSYEINCLAKQLVLDNLMGDIVSNSNTQAWDWLYEYDEKSIRLILYKAFSSIQTEDKIRIDEGRRNINRACKNVVRRKAEAVVTKGKRLKRQE